MDTALDQLSQDRPLHMTATGSFSPARVPVSTTATVGPNSETRVSAIGQGAVAAAINCLISWGWVLGCEGELYPPAWFRRARG